jgi:hypothetical protein
MLINSRNKILPVFMSLYIEAYHRPLFTNDFYIIANCRLIEFPRAGFPEK